MVLSAISNKITNNKPRYIICDCFGDTSSRTFEEVNYFLSLGYKPSDIFILAPSIKSVQSPVRKLENKINNQNFHESYRTLNYVMVALSYFGHIASIFLAFFMLSNILLGVMDNKPVVYVVTVIILSAIELLKRDIFHKFSILYLKLKAFTKDVLPLFLLSITIIGISFYSSIKGAGEYSSKGDKIEQDFQKINKKYEDSITKVYQTKIEKIEKSGGVKEIALNKLYDQQNELNNLALSGNLTPAQKKLLKSLPSQIRDLETENKPFIESKKADIKSLEDERN